MSTGDITEITNLLGRYCHIVDRGEIETVGELFWPESVLHFNGEQQGLAAIVETYRIWAEEARAPVDNLRHMIFSPAIDIEGDRAVSVCYFNADGTIGRSKKPVLIKGRYEDRLERRGEEWRLAERRIIIH